MSAFSGPQGKGAARRLREQKRAAAEQRAATTPHSRTRAHRLRCLRTPETRLLCAVFGDAS